MRYAALALSVVLVLALCTADAFARGARGGGMRGGGMRGGGMSRPSGGARPSGGYNMGGGDFARPSGPMQRPGIAERPGAGNGNLGNGNLGNGNLGNGNRGDRINGGGGRIQNPIYPGGGYYGWNGGMIWYPVPYYYGGGFWGPWTYGVTFYGAIEDEEEHITYNSYQVEPGTPGETFLKSYQLTQVKCGPSGLVVVYGPENSVVCANPNSYVGVGEYRLETSTLELIALNAPAQASPSPAPTGS